MRLWLKDSERRPDPAPVATDDRTAFIVGCIAWLLGTVAVLVMAPDYVWTCVAGLAIGLIGLAWSIWRRRADRREETPQ